VRKNTSFLLLAGSLLLLLALLYSCSSPPTSYVIFCAGDSITEAGYPPFLNTLLKREGFRAKVLNQGKSGFNTKEYLEYLRENKTALADSHPDFILLQLGTNDVRTDHDQTSVDNFYANMKEIIRLFRDFETREGKKPRILLATIPPIPDGTPFPFSPLSAKRITQEINPLIQKIAAEEKCTLVDNYSVFLDSPDLLSEIHPSDQGYEALAKNWHNALKKQRVKPVGKT
jgi:lysophospholipase L1-like esterase